MTQTGAQLAAEADHAVVELVRLLRSLCPLAETGHPVRLPPGPRPVPPPGYRDAAAVAMYAARRVGVPLAPPAEPPGPPPGETHGRLVTDLLRTVLRRPELGRVPQDAGAELDRVIDETAADTMEGWRSPVVVRSWDGAPLRTYAAGEPDRPAVVIASACGMPAVLAEAWMRFLAGDRYVVTWETRGLFGALEPAEVFDTRARGVPAQAEDLIAVMDRHGVERAHVMGMCGGAVLALHAAAEYPQRVSALSLWHGDYELGPDCPKTEHQRNLKALMDMAVDSRSDATAIHAALRATAMAVVPQDVAHLVVYPYLAAELFYRYCALTGAIMGADVAALLGRVQQPSLVVTSADDRTAHPAGSHRVAARLRHGELRVEPHGDHLSVFAAGPRLRDMLVDFLDRVGSAPTA
ncbi:MAG: alpha/beta hydrolase [Actinobacteria bacterium]|nr:alpha/beta hydrolase [Actinomycetota bacterium]